ncbi:TIR domain-containing protein [Nitrosomonas aestuarii]|uniref:TIR domain-containing protein n=1 Tax=Nitrosomonas aestuarii TaxID=52441 RepID=A0A1I4CUU7_9PROT|nr:toll/interleukin-1 receptor domain-containing protein [Nitrosomonas aestuarii]SFK84390.1 TIR domain-containing protein [Nitrosomonas aestuarii]
MTSVFLAHSSSDKEFVRALAGNLTKRGVKVWLDESELLIGDSLIGKIQIAIGEMKYLAAIISSHSVTSQWVQKELEAALSIELEKREVKVLPIVIDDCELPNFLIGKLYADFRKAQNYEAELDKIVKRVLFSEQKNDNSTSEVLNRLRLLEIARRVASGEIQIDTSDLDKIVITLYSILEGSHKCLSGNDLMQFCAFIASFGDVYPTAFLVLQSVAEYDGNSDKVIAASLFGLSTAKSRAGIEVFQRTIRSKKIDPYDKFLATNWILKKTNIKIEDLGEYFWSYISESSYGKKVLRDHMLNDIKSLKKDEVLLNSAIPDIVLDVVSKSEHILVPYYRNGAFENHAKQKRKRLQNFASYISTL